MVRVFFFLLRFGFMVIGCSFIILCLIMMILSMTIKGEDKNELYL